MKQETMISCPYICIYQGLGEIGDDTNQSRASQFDRAAV